MDADALIADLDPDQRAAVTTPSHLVAVVAGAGSGKTRVLTRRVAYRVATGDADAHHTLVLTFTREAAGELRRRLIRLGVRDHVEAGTFHSVMLAVLKQRWSDVGRRPRTIVSDRRRLVREALSASGSRSIDTELQEIGWAKARAITPEAYAGLARRRGRRPPGGVDRAAEAYAAYEQLTRRRGVIDFDDVLLGVLREAERDIDFADALRWRFRHLLVDEAQDLNPVQHRLVDLLRRGRDDLFLVGDPAQAIYGFNGADPSLLVEVETRFPGVEVVRLPVNHRCTPQVVGAGRHVLRASGDSSEVRSARSDGPGVTLIAGDDERDEAAAVARFVARSDPNLVRSGSVAVLARTHAQLPELEAALTERGLSVRRSSRAQGSPIQLAVRTAAALTSPSALRGWAHDTLDDVEALEAPGADRTLLEAERQVAGAVLEFLRDQPRGDGATFRSWVATTDPFHDRATDGVELLTFHAAKGREWHTVVVSGVETSLVPHRSATTKETRAEEARLLYVAMTRATDRLVLTRAARRGGYGRNVSPLIADLDLAEPPLQPPPRELLRRTRSDSPVEALRVWRADAARRANVLPAQLCTDHDLMAIADKRPSSAEELAEVTSMGLITARRLAPELLPLL